MELRWLTGTYAVCRLDPTEPLPLPVDSELFAMTWTRDEISLVCPLEAVPEGCGRVEQPWRAFVVQGPLDFALTGVLASISEPLAQAEVSIFAVSTYDTDYVLVPGSRAEEAEQALHAAGHRFE